MKKIVCFIFSCLLVTPLAFTSIHAEDTEKYEGFDSKIQYEHAPDYYDAERVKAREEKIAQAEERLKQRKSVYSISLPLRAQKYRGWCGAAVAEMIVDYQLGPNNIYTQDKLAAMMGMTPSSSGSYISLQAAALREATKLNYEVTRTADYDFTKALKSDINAYVGLSLPVDLYYVYNNRPHSGAIGHSLAAKGYSDANTVIFLDPWNFDGNYYGQHEISISQMLRAINGFTGYYIW